MQGRFKFWIMVIAALFIIAFLVAFAPVRPVPKGFGVQNTYRYSFTQPLVGEGESLEEVSARIQGELREQVADLNYAKLLSPTALEAVSWATTEEAAARHRQQILQALQDKYEGVKSEALARETQRPLTQLGNWLAIFAPKLQVRLGLDLQGGAHVVLLAKPETTMIFASPEDHPMIKLVPTAEKPAEEGTPAAAEPVAANLQTPEEIQRHVTAALAQIGVEAETVTVDPVAADRLVVKTQAPDEEKAQAHEQTVLGYLQNAYPGVEVKLDKRDSIFVESNTAEKVRRIIEIRVYESGVREAIIQTQGKDRIIVELPGVKDPERVIELLGKTALLEFALIPEKYEPPHTEDNDYSFWTDKYTHEEVPWRQVFAESEREFTGRDLKTNARVQTGQGLDFVVGFELRNERKEAFRRFTGRNVGRYMAIVLDGVAESAPVIRSEIPGSGIIEGQFGAQEANDLALLLNAGALPVPLVIAENRTVSATLGADSIRQSLIAGLIGLALVLIFMPAYYRLPGLLADLALLLYLIMLMALLTAAGATLTLPGIAGLIMSLGMAVDANIIIFERLKEELYSGKSSRSAIAAGFDRAWTAIVDANVTTLIGTAVLYFLGTSSVRSFAVTLFLGVLVSFFTAVTITRWLVTMVAHTSLGQRLSAYGVSRPEE